jgi:hypothetical protein
MNRVKCTKLLVLFVLNKDKWNFSENVTTLDNELIGYRESKQVHIDEESQRLDKFTDSACTSAVELRTLHESILLRRN